MIIHRVSKKLAMSSAILDSKEESDEVERFCEENIETILEHRARSTKQDFASGSGSLCAKVAFWGDAGPPIDFEAPDFCDNL
jgi:hypothetical protein